MSKGIVIVILIIIFIFGGLALGYRLGYNSSERALIGNICMAKYAEEDGTFSWMYVGDDHCSPRQRAKAKMLVFD